MKTVPIQCRCGQVVQVSQSAQAPGIRCPSCGAQVAVRSPDRGTRRQPVEGRGALAERELDADVDGAGYGIVPDAELKRSEPDGRTWVAVRGTDRPRGQPNWNSAASSAGAHLQTRRSTVVELPGPFFSWPALFYPFLYPTWARWLGLSFLGSLAAGVISITLFVAWIVIRFQLFMSVFAISSMTMVNLALVSYLVACFVEVIEETAAGEERLEQLIDMSWWEILPRFARVGGAAVLAAVTSYLILTPLRTPLAATELAYPLTMAALWLQVFPILLITNLVDNTIIPFKSLPATLRRLSANVGYFALFQLLAFIWSALAAVVFSVVYDLHWIAGIAAAGPIGATWCLYYGHWVGRLARQLSDSD